MWNSSQPDSRTESNEEGPPAAADPDPRLAAVSALASFSQQPTYNPAAYAAPPGPPPPMDHYHQQQQQQQQQQAMYYHHQYPPVHPGDGRMYNDYHGPPPPHPDHMHRMQGPYHDHQHPPHPQHPHRQMYPPVNYWRESAAPVRPHPDHNHRQRHSEEDGEDSRKRQRSEGPPHADAEDDPDEEEDDDDDEEDDEEEEDKPAPAPRGKPEAMAVRLAAAQVETKRLELEEEQREREMSMKEEAVAEPIESSEGVTVPTSPIKPKSKKRPPSKKPKKKEIPLVNSMRTELLLSEVPVQITPEEYVTLEALLFQFCKVPLLAEFSRPVSLLHPEVRHPFWCLYASNNMPLTVAPLLFLLSLIHPTPRLFLILSTWDTFVGEFVDASTRTSAMFAWTCGASLPTASNFTPIPTIKTLYLHLCLLHCI
jgi:hypothetical protein